MCLSYPTVFNHCLDTCLVLSVGLCRRAHLILPSVLCFLSIVYLVFPHYYIPSFIQPSCHNISVFPLLVFFFFPFWVKVRVKQKSLQKHTGLCATTYLIEFLALHLPPATGASLLLSSLEDTRHGPTSECSHLLFLPP